MHAAVFIDPNGDRRLGRVEGDTVVDAGPADATGFVPSAEAWAALGSADGSRYAIADVALRAPIMPGKLLAIGLNYRSHAQESDLALPDVPVVFAKWPSSVIGPGETIVIPREETRPDWEGELGVVIGRRTYRATLADAIESVGAITAVHDVSGRRAQLETPLRQFVYGKSFDTFCPIGPYLRSMDGVDLTDVDVRTRVSGELMQDANTRDLIFPVAQLIEYLSRGTTLEPGDLILTGTPGGVGDSRVPPQYLRHGDVVDITVGDVGTLSNPVAFEA